ncbi:MAG: hypothetical protein ACFFCQ_04435 [Promethearchaeota archaeon]
MRSLRKRTMIDQSVIYNKENDFYHEKMMSSSEKKDLSVKIGPAPSLRTLQKIERKFDQTHGWGQFSPSQIFIHLIEELGEIGSHLLWQTGYKTEQIGHRKKKNKISLETEFGQCLSLFLHLANSLDVDLQTAYLKELERMEQRFVK